MPADTTSESVEPFTFPTVLTHENLAQVLGEYLHRLETLQLQVADLTGAALLEGMQHPLACGPYPTMRWTNAAACIERDLILLYGTRALFGRLPFNNYALDFADRARSGVHIMSRLGDDIAIGLAVPRSSRSWHPDGRRRLARRLRADPDPEIRYRILLLENGGVSTDDRPRPRPGELWGLVDIRTGEVAFLER